jgi:hypothetical protein
MPRGAVSVIVTGLAGRGLPEPPMSKLDIIKKYLNRKSGASMTQLIKATGWQAHSVRAAISRMRKTGADIERTATNKGTTVYRQLVTGAAS